MVSDDKAMMMGLALFLSLVTIMGIANYLTYTRFGWLYRESLLFLF